MSHTSAGGGRATRGEGLRGRRRAAGIYGAIVTAATFTAAGGQVRTITLALAVVITLVLYWIAEEYAEVLGEQTEQRKLAGRGQVRADLAATWPMVSTSYLPLLVLVLARLSGASDATAANIGLGAAVAVVTYYAWDAGRAARLQGRHLILATCTAAALGVVLILLKNLVLSHLH